MSAADFPRIGIGCGPLGGNRADMTSSTAHAVLEASWNNGIRFFDTAPWYGNTQSEHRVGAFLRDKPRDQFMLTTKVGRYYQRPEPGFDFACSRWQQRWPGGLPMVPQLDYTHDAILRSFEDSIQRLGINRINGLAIHDLDTRHHVTEAGVLHGFEQLDQGGGYRALADLKAAGEIDAIGVGINLAGYIPRFLERFDIDYFLVAMPYTLVDQQALAVELPLCAQHGSKVIVGAPFASGILATGAVEGARYAYQPAGSAILQKVAAIEELCRAYGVALPAAALQFPLAHPVVRSVVFGADTPTQLTSNIDALNTPIPDQFWRDLKQARLIADDAPVPMGSAAR